MWSIKKGKIITEHNSWDEGLKYREDIDRLPKKKAILECKPKKQWGEENKEGHRASECL